MLQVGATGTEEEEEEEGPILLVPSRYCTIRHTGLKQQSLQLTVVE
jgi:hypothetical protein